ncbi:heat shock 70 kDa protein 14-like isoform X2 [Tachypleus tridentatus]|uniref:heat shock 70 kDa protein 14-like isoform X2 n=1 Tax=Tachypleus tridentatus TaxID=6853 RepID=UPI003FD5ECA6
MAVVCFGLHLGSTNMCLALHKEGKTEVIANDAGDRVTPAVVAFTNNEVSVGLAAKQGLVRNAASTVCNVKQVLGKNLQEMEQEMKNSGCKILTEGEMKYEIENDGKICFYKPSDILVLLFKKMLDIAKSHVKEDESHYAVVTVPFHYQCSDYNIIRESAIQAGFTVLRIISEGGASALAYGVGQESSHSSCNCLVYRMGGTSLDITILKVMGGIYQLGSNIHRSSIGGNTLTRLLRDFCLQEFQKQYRVDIQESKRSLWKLHSAAETCKHVLSTMGSAQCFAESLHEGIDFSINITRARFESVIAPVLQQCKQPIEEALFQAGLGKNDISKVILCGGSTKVPKIQQLVADKFPNAECLNSISPDEVIAVGAGVEAALLLGKDIKERPELSSHIIAMQNTLYIKSVGSNGEDLLVPIIRSGTPVPTRWQDSFHLPEGQNSVCLEFFKGYQDDMKQTDLLAKLVMKEIPDGVIVVSCHIRSDGSVHFNCVEKNTGKSESVTIINSEES